MQKHDPPPTLTDILMEWKFQPRPVTSIAILMRRPRFYKAIVSSEAKR